MDQVRATFLTPVEPRSLSAKARCQATTIEPARLMPGGLHTNLTSDVDETSEPRRVTLPVASSRGISQGVAPGGGVPAVLGDHNRSQASLAAGRRVVDIDGPVLKPVQPATCAPLESNTPTLSWAEMFGLEIASETARPATAVNV